jgi:hypothetical protein
MLEMIGDDRRILSAIYAKIDGQEAETATHGVLDASTWDYLKRAFAVGYGDKR